MQKIINVLAVASFALSGAVVVSGVYVYVNRDSIIDGIKSQVLGGIGGSALGGAGSLGGGALTLPSSPVPAPSESASAVPSPGLGIPNF